MQEVSSLEQKRIILEICQNYSKYLPNEVCQLDLGVYGLETSPKLVETMVGAIAANEK